MLKRMKKGFTLAEMLIVVAIIAVLTAIAVPVFVTVLGDANSARDKASINAVKTAGIARIMNLSKAQNEAEYKIVYPNNDGNMASQLIIEGTIDANNNITDVKIVAYSEDYKDKINTITEGKEGNKTAIVLLTMLDIKKTTAGT